MWPSGNPALPLTNCVVLVRPLNTPLCLSLPLCKMVIKKKQGLIGQRREGAQAGNLGGGGSRREGRGAGEQQWLVGLRVWG